MTKEKKIEYAPLNYETRDTMTAAVLKSQAMKFTTERRGSEVWFLFEKEEECTKIIGAHFNSELVVCSLDLANAIFDIKKIILGYK